ncbi:hypothetical protein [Absidia glauca]|uniref:Uncharacterized protein n=1 Tax=Absidia glauca TaxID=4829 RepID=A0A163J9A2_ABSGL|nr:hypothetical protein [Absidia glauca]
MGRFCGGRSPGHCRRVPIVDTKMAVITVVDPALMIYVLQNIKKGTYWRVLRAVEMEHIQVNKTTFKLILRDTLLQVGPATVVDSSTGNKTTSVAYGKRKVICKNLGADEDAIIHWLRLYNLVAGMEELDDVRRLLVKKRAIIIEERQGPLDVELFDKQFRLECIEKAR